MLFVLVQTPTLTPHIKQIVFEADVNSLCNIKDESVVIEPFKPEESDGTHQRFWEVHWKGQSIENRRLRKECILQATRSRITSPEVLRLERAGISSYGAIKLVLLIALFSAISILIIKIFLIKANQLSRGLFRASCIGVPIIFAFLLKQKSYFLPAYPRLIENMAEALMQTAMSLIAITACYFVVMWVLKGFKK